MERHHQISLFGIKVEILASKVETNMKTGCWGASMNCR